MPTFRPEFGTAGQTIVITLNSLANNGARQSDAWDWSQYLDILVFFQFTAESSAVAASGSLSLFAFATVNDGTTYSGGAGASDAAITLLTPTDLIFLGKSFLNANSQVRKEGPFSLASVFGGTLPAKGGIVVQNTSGAALAGSGHLALWQGVRSQTV